MKYDLQILADRIEFCWIHLRGVGALENSLWGYDGDALRIWLDALTISSHRDPSPNTSNVVENVRLPLEFYPLCRFGVCLQSHAHLFSAVLMDKGIIIGTEQEILVRPSLPFAIFRLNTNVRHVSREVQPLMFHSPTFSFIIFSAITSKDNK